MIGKGKKITETRHRRAAQGATSTAIEVAEAELEGAFAAADVVDPATGEVILEANEEMTPRVISMAQEKNIDRIEVFFPERDEIGLDPLADAARRIRSGRTKRR